MAKEKKLRDRIEKIAASIDPTPYRPLLYLRRLQNRIQSAEQCPGNIASLSQVEFEWRLVTP